MEGEKRATFGHRAWPVKFTRHLKEPNIVIMFYHRDVFDINFNASLFG